ncbi:MAG: alanine racemase [Nitrospirae bacterium]|nr:alanine racemase [Nitrospirota bacterium]
MVQERFGHSLIQAKPDRATMTPRHPTIAEINLAAFRQNLRLVRQRIGPHRALLAVVKANAYGHGIVPISKTAISENVQGLGVAFVEEGIQLRRSGIAQPILVMAGFLPEEIEGLLEHRLTPVVSHPDQIEGLRQALEKTSGSIGVHLKIDTGMGRLGMSDNDLVPLIEQARRVKSIEIIGLMSHLADDDLTDGRPAEDQIDRFVKAQKTIAALGLTIPFLHMANSAAILSLERAWFNMVRPGIMLYGYPPPSRPGDAIPVKPVMTLKTRIIHLKRVPAGTPVSYGRTYTTRRESLIAVLPIGYADGYSRAWSNRGEVLIGGRRVPVVGRVCMDMTMVDVTEVPAVGFGDEAVLIGSQGEETLSADELARKLGTIPYEILCAVSNRVPRFYHEGAVPS